jgi:hypothetical protein
MIEGPPAAPVAPRAAAWPGAQNPTYRTRVNASGDASHPLPRLGGPLHGNGAAFFLDRPAVVRRALTLAVNWRIIPRPQCRDNPAGPLLTGVKAVLSVLARSRRRGGGNASFWLSRESRVVRRRSWDSNTFCVQTEALAQLIGELPDFRHRNRVPRRLADASTEMGRPPSRCTLLTT